MLSKINPLPQDLFSQFNQLDKALIDASSIIYANKADFLKMLSTTVKLFSIQEILSEEFARYSDGIWNYGAKINAAIKQRRIK